MISSVSGVFRAFWKVIFGVLNMLANAAACYYKSSLSLSIYETTSSSTSVVLYSVCVFIYFGSTVTFHAVLFRLSFASIVFVSSDESSI